MRVIVAFFNYHLTITHLSLSCPEIGYTHPYNATGLCFYPVLSYHSIIYYDTTFSYIMTLKYHILWHSSIIIYKNFLS